jgi:hypothetical protein
MMSEFYEDISAEAAETAAAAAAAETATAETASETANLIDILHSLQSTLNDLKSAYNSMSEQLVDLEVMSQQEEKINTYMNWVYEHCEVDSEGKFIVADKQYTWIRFLKDVFSNKIDFTEIKKNTYPKNGRSL